MPARSPYPLDLIVIGAGSAGMAAALRAAQLGARTVLIDRAGMGGPETDPGYAQKTPTWSQTVARCLCLIRPTQRPGD
jgi:glutathione reductase (NADPH)